MATLESLPFTTKTVILPFHLPSTGAHILVSPGQIVSPGQKLATWRIHSQTSLDIYKALSVQANQVFNYLKRDLGELVHQGEVIASKNTFFGVKNYISPQTGILNLNHQNQLILQVTQDLLQVTAPIAARVKHVDARIVTLETRAALVTGQWGIGDQSYGDLLILSQQLLSDLTTGHHQSNLTKKLVLLDFTLDRTTYFQLNTLDISGLFCLYIDPELKVDLSRISSSHRPPVIIELGNDHAFDFSCINQTSGMLLGSQMQLLIFEN